MRNCAPAADQRRNLPQHAASQPTSTRGVAERAFALFVLIAALGCDTERTGPALSRLGEPPSASASADNALPPRPDPRSDPAGDGLPPVTLDGTHHATSVTLVAAGRQRIYSRAPRTWIYASPSRKSERLGYLRAGGSAPIAGEIAGHDRCKGGWFPILPQGYVCLDRRATLNASDPVVSVFEEFPADFSRKLPYLYGTVRNPGPVYARLPSARGLREAEPRVDTRMPRWFDAPGEIGASYAQDVWLRTEGEPPDPRTMWEKHFTGEVPSALRDGKALPGFSGKPRNAELLVTGRMLPRAGHAFLNTFFWEGRRYGISTGLELMPTDRFRPIRGSDFHGYQVGKDVKFPFALVRSPVAKYRSGKTAEYRAAIELTGKQQFFDGVLHYETRGGEWISDRYASRLDPAKRMPGWGKNGEKWIDVNVTKQTLMLYEGTEPVFATLVSTGEAGLEDPARSTATKRGIFRIHTKHVTATMSSTEIGEEFELRDVPYVQYFDKEGYALHGAYWHDRFGMPKSHGCINLSPEDARRVFHWTEPQLPSGWHGVLLPLKGTVLFVHP